MHPTLRILALILLAVSIQFMPGWLLAAVGIMLAGFALLYYPRLLRTALRRTRWLFLVLLLVYAFATPGEYVAAWPFDFAPTYEGLLQGGLQAGRLAVMLAGLAIMLGTTPRDDLVGGIFYLAVPLRWLGLSPERFAARLWLTLHYVEQAPLPTHGSLWERMEQLALDGEMPAEERIRFTVPRFRVWDWMTVAAMVGLVLGWGMA
jgi:energy-coupling factor transport system permease protein